MAALNSASRVRLTIGQGSLNEICYPRVDQARTCDLGLLVTDGTGVFSVERRDTRHAAELPESIATDTGSSRPDRGLRATSARRARRSTILDRTARRASDSRCRLPIPAGRVDGRNVIER